MKLKNKQGHEFNPETLALGLGYDPKLSEGSVKPPVFLTSTFQFNSAEEGKRFFEIAYGLKEIKKGEDPGLIYSRINNPNLQIFEERIAAWDKNEKGAVFSSGMSAISTLCLAMLGPGDVVLSTCPVYGGTHYLFEHILPKYGIKVYQVQGGSDSAELLATKANEIGTEKVRMIYVETPANPSNTLIDLKAVVELAKSLSKEHNKKVVTAVDNTFLGPVFQRPALLGVDLVVYSATKFIGGHSDLVAGIVTGPSDLMKRVNEYRTILGTMSNPFTGWMLLRSLETLSIRMRRQAKNAKILAEMLQAHPKVKRVFYPGLLGEDSRQQAIYDKQCTGAGSLIGFEVDGGEEAAFKVLNAFELCRLAVSLGGTESLVEHPVSMTHSDICPEILKAMDVGPGFIRMSVGIEHKSDLLRDLEGALSVL